MESLTPLHLSLGLLCNDLAYCRWKATEFRQFLLYTGPVVLYAVLSAPVYNKFMSFSFAILILAQFVQMCEFSKTLPLSFVDHFGQLYGKENLVYNEHGLIMHLSDVKIHCHPRTLSGFPLKTS